ncbi:MAG: exodeoxyribonuclease V subunit gamma, partial [Acidobacteria bacterium]|nr:exodeoxyribonuclease V subunit gamma [Acidobacteriota bacterium]
GHLQADLETLVHRGHGDDPAAAPVELAPDDRSIRVVSGHSPMREAEILHDHLLDCFAALPGLEPGDILVMAPDIETYAPYLRAVFDSAPPGQRIPYTIADRSPRRESPVAEAFLALLRLADSRFAAPDVLGLLEFAPVRERFGLAAGDLERVRVWLAGANIRWGLDGPSKERLGLPPEPAHTWRAGLDRLLLGYALPPEADALFSGIAPAAGVEGDGAAVLGRLAELVAAFGQLARTLDGRGTRREWARRLTAVLDEFFVRSEEVDRETERLRAAIHDLGEFPGLGNEGPAYGLDAVRHSLEETLGQPGVEFGFLTGRVTCCSMVPMRSIPFRVIALLGLNDAEFPRQAPECGFDLMRREHRILDRSRRDEDRCLFLESLLSARDVLYISYIGRHARDNSALQPAVVVSQLIDYIAQGYRFPDAGPRRAPGDEPLISRLAVEHPLQPFSERYFTGSPDGALFTFSEADAHAAGSDAAAAPAVPSRLPPAGPEWRVVTPGQLTGFFRNPAKFLLVNRLQARFEREVAEPSGEEPFALDSLAKYVLKEAVLNGPAAEADPDPVRARLQAAGELPPGAAGRVAFAELWQEAAAIRALVAEAQGDAEPEAVAVELALPGPDGPLTIRGAVGGVYGGTLLRARPGEVRAVDRLSLWVEHLLLSAGHPGRVGRGVFIGKKKKDADQWSIAPVSDPATVLARLLEVFWEGVHGFIPFAPQSSDAFAAEYRKWGDAARAMRAAKKEWVGGFRTFPESNDFCLRLALGRLGVFAGDGVHEEFARLALAVFEPLLQAGEETR